MGPNTPDMEQPLGDPLGYLDVSGVVLFRSLLAGTPTAGKVSELLLEDHQATPQGWPDGRARRVWAL